MTKILNQIKSLLLLWNFVDWNNNDSAKFMKTRFFITDKKLQLRNGKYMFEAI